ncbi:MAG TPA: class I adenylate-forming enzyme family protein [Methylomirabilota bacterium]|jgi:long-chain acyl-CoA synthetase|nr:class I adenylate-forming enzyme family protein [Methylomirabilota bacterium]
MHVRGTDCWPASLVQDLVEATHQGRRVRDYPCQPPSVTALLDRAAERCPERDAVVTPSERVTWTEFRAETRRLAAGLYRRHGIKPGDRIGILLVNGLPFCLAVFACALLGAVAVTLSTKLKSGELRFMLENSGARVLLTNAEWWSEVRPLHGRIPCEAFYLTPPQGGAVGLPPPGTRSWRSLFDTHGGLPEVAVGEDDPAFIMYTSGTTGKPKGAIGTHHGIISSAITFERCYGLGDGERSLVAVPLFHVTGLIAQLLTMAYLGGTVVVMPMFRADEALRLLDAERVTHMVAAPTVYLMMMMEPEYRRSGASLRVLGTGGAPIAPSAVRAIREWLPGCRLHNTYGLTESSSPATVLPDADALTRIASVGRPVPTAELRTVSAETGAECGADAVGELWIHGPMVVPGYWANPEATARGMGDGWLRTGDLARIDADGYVTIMDRIKDMINRGGEKIFCVEVEEVLCGHASVLEAAVVGVSHPVYGEVAKACVVPRPGHVIDPADVRRWVSERLAKYKVPEQVEVLETLPRNANGKVVKTALRQARPA